MGFIPDLFAGAPKVLADLTGRRWSMNIHDDLSEVMFYNPGGSPPVMSDDEGIQPTQPGESPKVAISGVEHQSVLDGQGGQVGIWDEIGVNARRGQKVPEHLGMALRRLGNPHRLTTKPRQNLSPCVRHRSGRSNTRGLVASLRKASTLAHGRPTGMVPFNCRSNQSRVRSC